MGWIIPEVQWSCYFVFSYQECMYSSIYAVIYLSFCLFLINVVNRAYVMSVSSTQISSSWIDIYIDSCIYFILYHEYNYLTWNFRGCFFNQDFGHLHLVCHQPLGTAISMYNILVLLCYLVLFYSVFYINPFEALWLKSKYFEYDDINILRWWWYAKKTKWVMHAWNNTRTTHP